MRPVESQDPGVLKNHAPTSIGGAAISDFMCDTDVGGGGGVSNIYSTGCLEKKFTQEILNKIRSFWCTRLIFTRAHRKVGRRVW